MGTRAVTNNWPKESLADGYGGLKVLVAKPSFATLACLPKEVAPTGDSVTERNTAMNEQGEPPFCDNSDVKRTYQLCMILNNILMRINFSNDVGEILHGVVEESCKEFGYESAQIAMREGDNWVIMYANKLPGDLIGRSFTDEELPLAALAMTTKKPVAIDDAFHDGRTNNTELMKSLGI